MADDRKSDGTGAVTESRRASVALDELEGQRVDSVLNHVTPGARTALKEGGYTLEKISMAPDDELAGLKGVSKQSVSAIRQRVPFRDGSDS